MASWSTKRRLVYGGGLFVFVVIIMLLFFARFFYVAPTCFDGRKNGGESGVDCGGTCQFICTSDSLKPIVLWSKIFNISGDVYTAVSYVENPNINARNDNAEYRFTVLDQDNKLITVVEGRTNIPKNKRFVVFEPGIVIKINKPKSAQFEFTSFGNWRKDTTIEPDIVIEHGGLLSTSTVPRINGKVYNNSFKTITSVELDVLVLDSKENVVAASRTFVDNLLAQSNQNFVFTWPKPFDLGVEACQIPSDVALVLDKSGSMLSESVFPPEPFNTVKKTAKDFINNLSDGDQVAVLSFGTEAMLESVLNSNRQLAVRALELMTISTTTFEGTNMESGLKKSFEELKTKSQAGKRKVIVILTDGVPTEPTSSEIAGYPVISAQTVANEIKAFGVEIYTIGFGQGINEGFLKTIATDDAHYSFAPDKKSLSGVYENIRIRLCQRKPSSINVIYKTSI